MSRKTDEYDMKYMLLSSVEAVNNSSKSQRFRLTNISKIRMI